VQISDSQPETPEQWTRFQQVLDTITQAGSAGALLPRPIDFVLVAGDLVSHADSQSEWVQFVDTIDASLTANSIPYRAVPGNHDQDGFDVGFYELYIGDSGVWDTDSSTVVGQNGPVVHTGWSGLRIIGFNNSNGAWNAISDQDLASISARVDAAAAANQNVLLLGHHPHDGSGTVPLGSVLENPTVCCYARGHSGSPGAELGLDLVANPDIWDLDSNSIVDNGALLYFEAYAGELHVYVIDLVLSPTSLPLVRIVALLHPLRAATATAPTADFAASPLAGEAPLAVLFTDLSAGAPTSWLWGFGDGATSTEADPTHVYSTPGVYDVTLTATNATGSSTKQRAGYVTVLQPPPSQTFLATADAKVKSSSPASNYGTAPVLRVRAGDTTYRSYLRFDLTGLEGTVLSATLRLYATDPSDDGGALHSVASDWTESGITWDSAPPIGIAPLAGTAVAIANQWREIDVSSVVLGNGSYAFALDGTSGDSAYYSSREGANPPQLVVQTDSSAVPVAEFRASSTDGPAPLAVAFTDLSSGGPTSWLWSFGDGATSTERNPSHGYAAPGLYDVTLLAANVEGSDTQARADYIAVDSPPTLVFSHSGCADPTTPSPDPSIENWALDDLAAPGAVGAACGDAGVDAWEVSDPDPTLAGPRYRRDLPVEAVTAAVSGWSLRARVRVRDLADAVDGSALLEASVGGLRYRVELGSDAMGNTLVRREGDAIPLVAQAAGFEQTAYHELEISWDPTDGEADLSVDGARLGPDWAGVATLDSRIVFGAADVSGTGAARFSDLAFWTGVQDCRNAIDDDGDGRIDQLSGDSDPGCESPTDTSEKSPLRICDDGIDNDGDGLTDLGDPGCTSVTARSERTGFEFVKADQAAWEAAAGGEILTFDTTAANVGLATELGAPPVPGAFLCGSPDTPVASCQLHWEALNTGLCRDFTLRSLEAGGGITFDNSVERGGFPAWQDALSIGDINDHPNDDFEISFGAGDAVYAFGFHFVDNQREGHEGLTVYGPGDEVLGILPGNAAPLSDGNQAAFVGIVSPLPIVRVVFDEATDDDDIAIRDFRFGDPDPDADGLGDCAETGLGTDATAPDTDLDGLTDGAEVKDHGTSPTNADSDADGLSDGAEIGTYGSDPRNPDSDADGLADGPEVFGGTNPLVADTDADGLDDGLEVMVHLTDPLLVDTDGDSFSDGTEVAAGTDPLDPTSFPIAVVPAVGTLGRTFTAMLLLLAGLAIGGRRASVGH
jgi:PKD repeat protein